MAASGGAGIKELMARMGHDSERAALIYQHEARGADKMITDSIDAHVEAEQDRRAMTTARPVRWCQRANGPLMARKINNYIVKIKPQCANHASDLGRNNMERATGIEPA